MLPGKTDYLSKIREMGLFDHIITTFNKLAEPSKPVVPAAPKPAPAIPVPKDPKKPVVKSARPPKLSILERAKINNAFKSRYRKSRHEVITGKKYYDKAILGKGK